MKAMIPTSNTKDRRNNQRSSFELPQPPTHEASASSTRPKSHDEPMPLTPNEPFNKIRLEPTHPHREETDPLNSSTNPVSAAAVDWLRIAGASTRTERGQKDQVETKAGKQEPILVVEQPGACSEGRHDRMDRSKRKKRARWWGVVQILTRTQYKASTRGR
jgi:hypothetical protein